ncbi:TerB family tellurite resistance protein [Sphingobacterium hotanense]|uniref:TerB family tellurite resistance protein n=1 Tax=Sphingobacterium hotanense TaxID=649196 RepID=UPI0021A4775D|nr:TerB family tellurite resistance protein [Sphingobacterium hotanense]MCT1523837.1 TerB family tellurite resistance protein [Sphingobacterium hotanense]
MKKIIIISAAVLSALLPPAKASAQTNEIAQLLLNVEKLAQFKQILSDMKKGYEILNGGYNIVRNISEGNFSLHKAFLDGLMEVSPTVRNYRRVVDIADDQVTLVKEYKNAYDRFRRDNNFNPDELAYLGRVYDKLFKESLRNLDELLTVVTAGKARMSDDERLQAIDRIYLDMQDKLMFLRHFNNNTMVLAVQRAKERNDAQALQKIYGVND